MFNEFPAMKILFLVSGIDAGATGRVVVEK